ncbi:MULTISPECIES: hypothetical protein [unclassified Lonepinella]|uniref:hypothetical protein n=1 Tax=unclassified Lonepinella TaxID=2642006 RepID=UPI0036DA78AD
MEIVNSIIPLVLDPNNYWTNFIPIITLIVFYIGGILFTRRGENKKTDKNLKKKYQMV